MAKDDALVLTLCLAVALMPASLAFQSKLIEEDYFHRIRVPSNVLNPPGREFIVSSSHDGLVQRNTKQSVALDQRFMLRDNLEEHFSIHADGLNILAVNYGSPRACPYPRQSKLPAKWSFVLHAIFKDSKLAPRTPVFTKDALIGDIGEVEVVKPPDCSFWAKYWMYLIPHGLIVVNALTQAMNVPEDYVF